MNSEKAHEIIGMVDGFEAEDGLSTVGIALIHLSFYCGLSKDDLLHALSKQWDLYHQHMREVDAREKQLN